MVDAIAVADTLIAARKEETIVTLPEIPESLEESYAVQDAIIARIGNPVFGWKAAFTNAVAMEKMKTDEPAVGPLFEEWVYRSGESVPSSESCLRRIECEYAFRLARGLPARDAPYTAEDVGDAVGSLHPAIEIVHSRVADAFDLGARVLVADHCVNFAFVYGQGVSDWRGLDLIGQPVTLSVDGETAAQGSGADVLGDPMQSLTWLVNKLSGRGTGLAAGAFVTTGSCTGMHPVPRRCKLVADFGPLGQCEATCTA
jgi:2-keto-4-pentenoate hydratase